MLAPGAVLQNRYRVVRLSERNPSHSVYDAVDQRFGGTVTVKELLEGGAEAARLAFAREAMLLNRVSHAALPYVFDTFLEGTGIFLVAEHVPGETLASVLLRRHPPVDVAKALEWADRLLDLLEVLHESTPPVVHANICPQSLRITPRGEVYVADFSLCLEAPGVATGYTLPYAPYEQIQGYEIDALADIYGLAATLYHALTDEQPPNAYERMSGWANAAPVVLRPMDELNPAVPPAVSLVIQEALALSRADRTPSAAEFRFALKRAVAPRASFRTEPVEPDATTEPVLAENARTEPVARAEAPTEPGARAEPPTEPVARAEAPTEPVVARSGASVPIVIDADAASAAIVIDTNAPTVALDPLRAITDLMAASPSVRSGKTTVMCRTCGAANDPLRVFCPHCGSLLRIDRRPAPQRPPAEKICEQCGAGNPLDAIACRMCAAAFEEAAPEPARDSTESPTIDLVEHEHEHPDAPAEADAEAEVEPQPVLAQLLVLEGEEPGSVLTLGEHATLFGRAEGDYTFPLDIFMSGKHAQIARHGDAYVLEDIGSRNGTYLKIRGETRLKEGDVVLAGKQLLRFEAGETPGHGLLHLLTSTGMVGETYQVNGAGTVIGRTTGDIQFGDDPSMADKHARIFAAANGDFHVVDCGTKNGTFLRVKADAHLFDGDILVFGRHIFRFELTGWQDDYSTLKSF
jgi:pSer/pThr/pTyr-binding forkhead associated (FHA) protein/ribosomal protein L40E